MGKNSTHDIYIISYLVTKAEERSVVGYGELAARLQYLANRVKEDERMSERTVQNIDQLIGVNEDNMMYWDDLKNFIESARTDQIGSMFIDVQTEETGPNEWHYRFESRAPESVLEDKMEQVSERDEALKQKVIKAAQVDDAELFASVYEQ